MPSRLAFAPPPDWSGFELAPPVLAEGSEVAIDRWKAWREPEPAPGRAVSACFGADVSTWVDDATPIALERLGAMAASVAVGLDPGSEGLRVVGEDRTLTFTTQRLARTKDPEGRVVARTVLGFAPGVGAGGVRHVSGCFVACAPTSTPCEEALLKAEPLGFGPPPAASAVARTVAFGVHHPRVVASSAASLFLLAGIVAVWTRPRPRRK